MDPRLVELETLLLRAYPALRAAPVQAPLAVLRLYLPPILYLHVLLVLLRGARQLARGYEQAAWHAALHAAGAVAAAEPDTWAPLARRAFADAWRRGVRPPEP